MSESVSMKFKTAWRTAVAFFAAILPPAKSWAAAATAVTAGFTATAAGVDPWPWVIGGFGAAIVYVKKPATTRFDAMANAVISVMIGGFIAPIASAYAAKHWDPSLDAQYAWAFALSVLWPWLVPAAFSYMKSKNSSGGSQS